MDAVIVAAGSASRFGGDKLTADLCGTPVVGWSLRAFEAADGIGRIVVVAAAERVEEMTVVAREFAPTRFMTVVAGGVRRRDSVEAGLRACRSDFVAIHDGARPLVTRALIERCVVAAQSTTAGAMPVVPVTDTIKEVRDSVVTRHPERSLLFAAQTPQVVRRTVWLMAADASDNDETDDAAMLDRLSLSLAAVEGDPENMKVTRPIDLMLARAILEGRLR